MGLEDRDWYRDNPSDAWRSMFPGRRKTRPRNQAQPPKAYAPIGPRPARSPARIRRKRPAKPGRWIATLAVGGALGLGYAAWQDNQLPWQGAASAVANQGLALAGPTPAPKRHARRPATTAKIVRLRSRPGLNTPATHVTRWWITDPRFGRVSVYVPVGTTPREALTRALAARGYQVLP